MSNFQYEMSNLFVALQVKKGLVSAHSLCQHLDTYTSHVDGTPEGAGNTGTKDKEGGVDKELISGTTEEQESVGGSLDRHLSQLSWQFASLMLILYLEESLLGSNVVGSVDERHF